MFLFQKGDCIIMTNNIKIERQVIHGVVLLLAYVLCENLMFSVSVNDNNNTCFCIALFKKQTK